jgi:hypothetical protein
MNLCVSPVLFDSMKRSPVRPLSAAFLLSCCLATASHAQYAPPPGGQYAPSIPQPQPPAPPTQGMTLAQKCALASAYLKSGNCGEQGCDAALCVALRYGCRINSWGYRCPEEGR